MPINRRRFLALSAIASLAPSAVVVANTRRSHMVRVNAYAVNAETPPDQHKWTLSVDGNVATAMQLTVADLRRMPVTEITCVQQCAGNGRWRGVSNVLDRAGVKSAAKHLHIFGSDDPSKSVPSF